MKKETEEERKKANRTDFKNIFTHMMMNLIPLLTWETTTFPKCFLLSASGSVPCLS